MYIEGKASWLNHLDAALEKNNNPVHRATHMTPFEARNKLILNVLPSIIKHNENFPKFQVGDFVRVPDKRNIYSNAYTTNWNNELFKIQKITQLTPSLMV